MCGRYNRMGTLRSIQPSLFPVAHLEHSSCSLIRGFKRLITTFPLFIKLSVEINKQPTCEGITLAIEESLKSAYSRGETIGCISPGFL